MREVGVNYRLDADHQAVRCTSEEWTDWMVAGGHEACRVAWHELPGGALSTVFIHVDHRSSLMGPGPPVLFETALLRLQELQDASWDTLRRWCTWEEALEGHRAIYRELLKQAAATEGAG